MQNTPKALSRRTVASGLAWSVPAVATVAAAPAFAASPVPCVNAEYGEAVKYPGGSTVVRQGYGFEATFTNNTGETVRIAPADVTVQLDKKSNAGVLELWTADPCQGGVRIRPNDDQLVLGAGDSRTLYVVVRDTGNSANESGCIQARLRVVLAGSSADSDATICELTERFGPCFDETPPTADC